MKTIQAILAATITFATVMLAEAAPAGEAPRRYVVAICTGLSSNQANAVFLRSMDFLLNHARTGDQVEFLATPQGNRLASVVVPDGAPRARANSREYAGKFVALADFLKKPAAAGSRQAMQLRLPQLLDEIARTHEGQGKLAVVVIGSPLYLASNEREAAFDMEKGLTPSDGMVAASVTESLFGTVERKGQLQNTTVYWLTPSDDWAVGEMHRRAVTRFWSLFIAEQGATLSTFGSDIARAFEGAAHGESSPVLTATLDPNDQGMVMRPPPIFRRETALPAESRVNIPPAATPIRPAMVPTNAPVAVASPASNPRVESAAIAKAVTEIPQTPPGRIGIAALWEAPHHAASTADVDLYVAARPGAPEVFWQRAEATDAVYFRDIRHAGPRGQSGDWTASWEYVEVNHARLEDMSVWLNMFDTKGSVKGIVRIQWNGKTVDKPFEFNLTRGNRGLDNNLPQRRQSPYWQEIKLRELFPDQFQTGNAGR
jgi:hypothetical protein